MRDAGERRGVERVIAVEAHAAESRAARARAASGRRDWCR